MTGNDIVLLNVEGPVATVTLNRPEALNAFVRETWDGLDKALRAIRRDPSIRAVIVTGAGERAFSAGIDIKAVAAGKDPTVDHPARPGYDTMAYMKDIFTAYEKLPLMVIAAINGHCLGVGLEFAVVCDMRLASDTARFSLPEVRLGVPPDMGSTQRLPRLVGPSKAKELICTARTIDAPEALRIGLVDYVYPLDRLMSEARKLAEEVCALSPEAVSAGKRGVHIAMSTSLDMGLQYEIANHLCSRPPGAAAEGARKMLERMKQDRSG